MAILGLAASLYSEFVFSFQEGLSYSKALPETSKDVSSISDVFYSFLTEQEKSFTKRNCLLLIYFISTCVMSALNRSLLFVQSNSVGVILVGMLGCTLAKTENVSFINQLHDARLDIHSVLYKWIKLRHISRQGMILENYDRQCLEWSDSDS